MSGTTSVPALTFGNTGYQAPTENSVLAGVLADMSAAFGGNLNPSLSTPQGQLASSLTAIIGDCNNQFLYFSNQVDPAYASGRMQDAIARIYFLTRKAAVATTVTATCTGLAGVQIPTGAMAQTTDGSVYICSVGGTIPTTGSVNLPFVNIKTGPISCPATTLSLIYRAIPGWDTINNASDGVVGNDAESRSQFETRRQQSVAQNGAGSLPAVLGAVLSVPNVLDAYVHENDSASDLVLDGVTLPAHSLYVCVSGGSGTDIAQAIWSKKSPGCAYSGNTTVTVEDTNSGYSQPYPSYNVTFQTAAPQTCVIAISIANSRLVPSNGLTQVQTAILNAWSGGDGGPRARIGSNVYASRFYSAVAALGAWAQIITIQMGSSAVPAATFTASIASTTMTVSAVASGALAVGQTIMATGLPDGIRITALGSGTGGTGTYTVSIAQTMGSSSVISVAAAANDVIVGIAHIPVLSAQNISLTLVT